METLRLGGKGGDSSVVGSLGGTFSYVRRTPVTPFPGMRGVGTAALHTFPQRLPRQSPERGCLKSIHAARQHWSKVVKRVTCDAPRARYPLQQSGVVGCGSDAALVVEGGLKAALLVARPFLSRLH